MAARTAVRLVGSKAAKMVDWMAGYSGTQKAANWVESLAA